MARVILQDKIRPVAVHHALNKIAVSGVAYSRRKFEINVIVDIAVRLVTKEAKDCVIHVQYQETFCITL